VSIIIGFYGGASAILSFIIPKLVAFIILKQQPKQIQDQTQPNCKVVIGVGEEPSEEELQLKAEINDLQVQIQQFRQFTSNPLDINAQSTSMTAVELTPST
jgi:hypothetical protein